MNNYDCECIFYLGIQIEKTFSSILKEQWLLIDEYYNAVKEGYNETDAISKCGGNTYKSKTNEEKEIIKEKIRQTKLGGKNPNATKIKCYNVETEKEYFFDSMAEAKAFFHQSNH